MAASGVETVRVAFDWRQSQAAAGGAISFAGSDAVVATAAAHRLPVLPVVHRTPDWASAGGPSSAPDDPAAYARFLTALVQRYGPNGSLWAERPDLPRMPIRQWQIWNEPNLTLFWTPQPFAKRYVALLKAARRAVRAQDPGAKIILAGLPNISWVALREIYQAGGRGSFDAVALHPYTSSPANIMRLVRLARTETRRFHDGRVPIWLTEISWAAARGKVKGLPGLVTNERGQATQAAQGAAAARAGAQAVPDPEGHLVHVDLPRGVAQSVRLVGAAPGPRRQDRQRPGARGVQARGAAIRSLSSASIARAVRSQVKPAARWRPAARSRSRSVVVCEQRPDGRRDLVARARRGPPRPRSPAARRCRRRRRVSRTPSPRARAGRSPRRGSGARTPPRPRTARGAARRGRRRGGAARRAPPRARTAGGGRRRRRRRCRRRAGRAPAGSCAWSGRRRRGRRDA